MRKLVSLVVVFLLVAGASAVFGGAGKSGHDHSEEAKQTCPLKDKKVQETKKVELKGQLVCMSCDLNKEKECRKVFQTTEKEPHLYTLCPKSDLEGLEKASNSGTLTVRGTLMSAEDENEILLIEGWEVAEGPGA